MSKQERKTEIFLGLAWVLLAVVALTMAGKNESLTSSIIPPGFSTGFIELATYEERAHSEKTVPLCSVALK